MLKNMLQLHLPLVKWGGGEFGVGCLDPDVVFISVGFAILNNLSQLAGLSFK